MAHTYPPDEPLSLAHLSEIETAPEPLIRAAAAAGFASVGLRIAPASPGGIVYPLATSAEQAAIRSLCAATGTAILYVEMIGLGAGFDPAVARRALETGAALGATRLAVSGDGAETAVLADQMATVCALAAPLGIAVDLEFMPYRGVATLADAAEVVRRAGAPNGHVLVDALHMQRSASPAAAIAALPEGAVGTYQICDAPAAAPPFAELVAEARTRRLLAGHGGIDLAAQIGALPPGTPLGVEVPLYTTRPDLDLAARLALLVSSTRDFLHREARR